MSTMETRVVLAALANCPHMLGIHKFSRIAKDAGAKVLVLDPGTDVETLLTTIRDVDATHIGLSYRMSPDVGLDQISHIMERLSYNGLMKRHDGSYRKVAFAGLPETTERIRSKYAHSAVPIYLFSQEDSPLQQLSVAMSFLDVPDALKPFVTQRFLRRIHPPRVETLDQMAKAVVKSDYTGESPLPIPSESAKLSEAERIAQSEFGIIYRAHFGAPGETTSATVQGIEGIAEQRALDLISLGSSDLSQRFFEKPELWKGKKNDGGVPYRTVDDLVELYQATRRGNYPGIKPYAHVDPNMADFVDVCVGIGYLVGVHQAIPLFWFNELDSRGPMTLGESIREHGRAIKNLVAYGIPVEINDPNQWNSRWAHDGLIVADYAIITAFAVSNGVRDFVPQLQFNKPAEISDFGDFAKIRAAIEMIDEISAGRQRIWRQTRTGIGYFSPDPETARFQLARSTLQQLLIDPKIIHVVSYCEADHAATEEDVIESSLLVRRAVRMYQEYKHDLQRILDEPEVVERKEHLKSEARILLGAIARLNPRHTEGEYDLVRLLSDPKTLTLAVEKGYLSAPGIFSTKYPAAGNIVTDIVEGGYVDCVDPLTGDTLLEAERVGRIQEESRGSEAVFPIVGINRGGI
jgi:hypothetical protein